MDYGRNKILILKLKQNEKTDIIKNYVVWEITDKSKN